tara:strand:- start:48139 stop:49521 length:1383 start_codon:yes stop_codon:yes gene_type:complete
MNKYSFCLFILTFVGCNTEQKETPTIFAGEIVNPTSETIILYKDDVVIDSAQLDMHNRFSIRLDTIVEGLYNFRHSPQYQYVYLSKGDSLLVRLNTIYFDESLVFSGKGEEINNFLVEVFLNGEDEEALVDSYYDLDPIPFSKKIDSLRQIKINLLNDLEVESALSPKSLAIANASINYGSYISKEKYPYKHHKKTKNSSLTKISDSFYEYRKKLNFDNKELTYFTPYYDFMKRHFDNLAYTDCTTDCENGERIIKNHLHFNRHKLKLIDSIVKEKELRDNLFRNVAMSYFLKVHDNIENNKIFLEDFHKLSSNNRHITEIHDLYEGVIKMQPNHSLPAITVLDSMGTIVSLKAIAEKNKNVIFYFWTSDNPRHFASITKQAAKLSDLHPEITFIGISLTPQLEKWQTMIQANNQSFSNQYKADNVDELRSALIIDGLNKAILTKDGVIVDAYKDMYSSF